MGIEKVPSLSKRMRGLLIPGRGRHQTPDPRSECVSAVGGDSIHAHGDAIVGSWIAFVPTAWSLSVRLCSCE